MLVVEEVKRRRGRPATVRALPAPDASIEPAALVADIAPEVGVLAEATAGHAAAAINEGLQHIAAAVTNSEEGEETMATMAETVTEGSADRARVMFGEMNERAKSAMEKGTKVVEDLIEFAKGNVEAVVASGRAAAKGTETLVQEASDYGRKSFESASSAARSYAAAKSPTELFQLNSELGRSMFDGMMAEASRFSETYVKVMSDVVAPISSRMSLAAEKFKAAAY